MVVPSVIIAKTPSEVEINSSIITLKRIHFTILSRGNLIVMIIISLDFEKWREAHRQSVADGVLHLSIYSNLYFLPQFLFFYYFLCSHA